MWMPIFRPPGEECYLRGILWKRLRPQLPTASELSELHKNWDWMQKRTLMWNYVELCCTNWTETLLFPEKFCHQMVAPVEHVGKDGATAQPTTWQQLFGAVSQDSPSFFVCKVCLVICSTATKWIPFKLVALW